MQFRGLRWSLCRSRLRCIYGLFPASHWCTGFFISLKNFLLQHPIMFPPMQATKVAGRIQPARGLCSTSWLSNEATKVVRPSPRIAYINKDPKAKLRAEQEKKNAQKRPAETHPLYQEVPQALRYLRAAEVGQPAIKTTISLQLNIVPEKGSTPLSGQLFLPKPIKDNTILVFTSDSAARQQLEAMGDHVTVGGQELIDQISDGTFGLDKFTQCFATPEMVKDLRTIGRNLGTRNLMPTPKKGTVVDDVPQAIQKSAGALNFKQKGNLLMFPIGRCDFSDADILRNLKAASDTIYGLQPPGTKKPNLIGQAFLNTTLGPSVLINIKK